MTRRDATKSKKEAKPGYSHEEVYARYKEQVPNNMDFTAPRNERVFPMPGFLKSLFAPMLERPEKEMICLEFMFNATVVVVPRASLCCREVGEEREREDGWANKQGERKRGRTKQALSLTYTTIAPHLCLCLCL